MLQQRHRRIKPYDYHGHGTISLMLFLGSGVVAI
jgi:hypothetical protein